MSKIEITTDSKGTARIYDPRTGKSEVIQLSKKTKKQSIRVDYDSSGVPAHMLHLDCKLKAA